MSDLNPKFLSWTEPDIDRKINRTPEPDIWAGQFTIQRKKSHKERHFTKGFTFIQHIYMLITMDFLMVKLIHFKMDRYIEILIWGCFHARIVMIEKTCCNGWKTELLTWFENSDWVMRDTIISPYQHFMGKCGTTIYTYIAEKNMKTTVWLYAFLFAMTFNP